MQITRVCVCVRVFCFDFFFIYSVSERRKFLELFDINIHMRLMEMCELVVAGIFLLTESYRFVYRPKQLLRDGKKQAAVERIFLRTSFLMRRINKTFEISSSAMIFRLVIGSILLYFKSTC